MSIILRGNVAAIYQPKPGVATSFPLTTNGDVEPGDECYGVSLGWQGSGTNGALIAGITDDQSGVWTRHASIRRTGNNHVLSFWRGVGMSGGAPLTATAAYDETGAAGNHSLAIVSAGGMTGGSPVIDTDEDSSGSAYSTKVIDTAVDDVLAFAVVFPMGNEGNTISIPTGWTPLAVDTANFTTFRLVYRILSARDMALQATGTLGGTSANPLSIIAAFPGTGSGGGGGGLYMPGGELLGGFTHLTGGLQ